MMTMGSESAAGSGTTIHLAAVDLEGFESVERSATIRCASGHRSTASWRGTPVAALVDATDCPPETTHLCFESHDGYRACLDLHTALESVLAVGRDRTELDPKERPRLVCPGIEGVRTVKGVRTIEPVSLSRTEDPERLEALDLEGGTDG